MSSNDRLRVILNHMNGGGPLIKNSAARKYFYTLDSNILTEAQRDFYEENGFLVVPNLIDHDSLDIYKQRFLDLCNGKVEKGFIQLIKDKSLKELNAKGEYLINKAQDILCDDVLFNYAQDPRIVRYVECFTGPNIMAVNSMLINKPPDSGKLTSIHPLHQDLHYFPFRPAERIVASWTAMEKITVDNGCLFVIPGTHKSSLQPHSYPEADVNKGYHGIRGFDLVSRVNLEMEKGDTVFFHPLVMHGSGPNLTKGCRKAICCHYASSDCYYVDVTGTTQENIANEIESIIKIYGMQLTYKEYWQIRQRLIKGRTGTLA